MMCPAPDGQRIGHPIIPATGEKILDEADYLDRGPAPLDLVRMFRSSRVVGLATGQATAGLGQAWSHNHHVVLKVDGTAGTAGSTARVIFGNGTVSVFAWNTTTSSWQAIHSDNTLTPNAAGLLYKLQEDDSSWQFDSTGKLLASTARNGWATSYSYSTSSTPAARAPVAGLLIAVSNVFGRTLSFTYNLAGQLIGVTAPDGQTIGYQYDSATRLATATFPGSTSSVSKTYLYENPTFAQLLTGIVDENGNRLATYAYDSQGRGISTQYAGGADLYRVDYGAAGSATVTDPLGTPRTYTYASNNGRLAVTSADKPSASGLHDAASRIQDASGLVTEESDFLGVKTMYTWDTSRRLTVASTRASGRPEAQASSIQWHPAFRLPTLVSENGRQTAYTYDTTGNLLTQTVTDLSSGQIRRWAWSYNSQGLVQTATSPNGGITQHAYDAQGNRVSMANALGHVSTMTYDAAGRMTQLTEPNGLTTNYSYDPRGRLVTQTHGGETTAYTYTLTGQLASATLPNGYHIAYSYDAAQRLTGAQDNRGNSVMYTLDGMGNRTREEVKDASGSVARVTSRLINSLNRITAIQGASGQTNAFGFDANGEPVNFTDPLNQTTHQSLDALRRPVATTFADNSVASQAWNALDQLTQATDPKGVATQYQHNAFGEVIGETSPDTGSTSWQRDAAGEVIAQTDAKGNTTQITRDALGRPVEIRRSATDIAHLTWDAGSAGAQVGHLVKMQDSSGSTVYARDPFGRVLSKTQTVAYGPGSPGSFTTTYSYINGDPAAITYPSGLKVFYRRNASGQITGLDTRAAGTNKPVQPFISGLTYTALGQPKAWNWASGDTASRSFDSDGRMTANEFARYSFDAASRITGISQDLWASRSVTVAGQTSPELYKTSLNFSASYDSRNRLSAFGRPGAQSIYSYDANSNRLGASTVTTRDTDLDGLYEAEDFTRTSSQVTNIEATSNRLLGFTQTFTKTQDGQPVATTTTTVNYSLDANGNLTADDTRNFDYDSANRLGKTRFQQSGEEMSVAYLYNAQGQRVFKSEAVAASQQPQASELGAGFVAWLQQNFAWLFSSQDGTSTSSLGTAYVYGESPLPEWALLGDYDNGSSRGVGTSEYLWLPLEAAGQGQPHAIPVGLSRGAKLFAVHSDHLGTPRLLTNNDNRPVWQWPYSAFGNNRPTGVLRATPNPRQAMTNAPVLLRATAPLQPLDLRMPGQSVDSETGQFYNYFRNYDPTTGRYSQSDPIGLAGGWNRFAYVGGDPLSYIDPDGLLEVHRDGNVTVHAYPGPQAGGNEHARQGPGGQYHVHVKDGQGREARMSTETWKPLTPEDQRIYDRSKEIQKTCEKMTDYEKKLLDRVNRQVFHNGLPTTNQSQRLLRMRFGGRRAGGGGSD